MTRALATPPLSRDYEPRGRSKHLLLALDAAYRLGPRPALHYVRHRAMRAAGLARLALRAGVVPAAPFLPLSGAAPPPAPPVPAAHGVALREAAARAAATPTDWHGPFSSDRHALELDLFGPGDVRPVWERSRLSSLLVLVQAARLDPAGGHLPAAEALLQDWVGRNPPFRGANWACGQEAALRALHLALTLALLEADRNPPAGARILLEMHAQRIIATPAYAMAQDNNHPVSEAAGLLACGLLLRDRALAARGARRLSRTVLRLVSPCGAFAQPSAEYQRLLLDTLSIAEWLRRRHGGPPMPAQEAVNARACAAAAWLFRLADPVTGATPRTGHCDGSVFADLSLAGPRDARSSLERAARLFAGRSAGLTDDPGCTWLGLAPACPRSVFDRPARWCSEGWAGWEAAGARALLRTGVPLRFRPAHADLLHLDLWDGPLNLLRDGGTGAYNPPPESAWWLHHLQGTAAHNSIAFDGRDQMPRLSRFLLARWPRAWHLPDGAGYRDQQGCVHERRVHAEGRVWTVQDRVSGPFRTLALRWRLAPGQGWRLTPRGVVGRGGAIESAADTPIALTLAQGWESPAYGRVEPVPVLEIRAEAPVSWLRSTIRLP